MVVYIAAESGPLVNHQAIGPIKERKKKKKKTQIKNEKVKKS